MFQDEYVEMLQRFGVEYDERYLWESVVPPSGADLVGVCSGGLRQRLIYGIPPGCGMRTLRAKPRGQFACGDRHLILRWRP